MIAIMSDRIQDLFADAAPVDVVEGGVVFRTGAAVSRMFWIERGEVALLRYGQGGETVPIQRVRDGGLLAEASLFAERYHCDAVALRKTRFRVRPRGDVRGALERDPALLMGFAETVSRALMTSRIRAEIRSLKRVSDRLDLWLAVGNEVPGKGGRRHLADELGVTPEAIYRELARRRKKGPAQGRASPTGR